MDAELHRAPPQKLVNGDFCYRLLYAVGPEDDNLVNDGRGSKVELQLNAVHREKAGAYAYLLLLNARPLAG